MQKMCENILYLLTTTVDVMEPVSKVHHVNNHGEVCGFQLSAVKPKTKLEVITQSMGKLARASYDWIWFYL